ncbi:type I-D CRISPR-associated protein Cas10d/Csc3 [Leptolyngbya ohadii]|uniref:type I-D CRISPR-associated protein Cas10d/Csc3 n=1 Tax=Leptolyngbya ohadii TaxID=1962290 RepID=UPI000B59CAD5|nr:type I-D CRISPR-associated protein Cas10d/Csc3 [Leptolyngbya ohadii]
MTTLLQTLLVETLPEDTDPILRSFIETILPGIEREFSLITALGGSEDVHYQALCRSGEPLEKARQIAFKFANKPDQSLLVHVLNALLTAWNLSQFLPPHLHLSEVEKRLLCLGMTLHDYDKVERGQIQELVLPKAHEIPKILEVCEQWGDRLNFQTFWTDWKDYLLDIAYLAQNTQFSRNSNPLVSIWEQASNREFHHDDRRLDSPLRHLLAFGDIAVHMNDPADIVTTTRGDRLRDHLDWLEIRQKLTYHRLRDCRGLLTNQIHNAVVHFAHDLNWEPILYFAQGTVYLAPENSSTPTLKDIQETVWHTIIHGDEERNQTGLTEYLSNGDIGFIRDGKGLRPAPLALEFFTPIELINLLPFITETKVANFKEPATPKRLKPEDKKDPVKQAEKRQKILVGLEEAAPNQLERSSIQKFLDSGGDIRADRIAEAIIFMQREFFSKNKDFPTRILNLLNLQDCVTPEQTQVQSGGTINGWYYAAAKYIARHPSLNLDEVSERITSLSKAIAEWAHQEKLLSSYTISARNDFFEYIANYLEILGWHQYTSSFQNEFNVYSLAKIKNKPICSLGGGEYVAEEQEISVVLFKPQQYSNKNALGGGRIKRGISKIWSLEMLLRQAYWKAPAGKLEEQQPIFLYVFPAYVYSPQTAKAIKLLMNELKRVNLWEVRKHWVEGSMASIALQTLIRRGEDEVDAGQYGDRYSNRDLPFMAMTYTTTRGKTLTDAWVEPAFLALALPRLLGVKAIATASPDPLYASDKEFFETVKLDGAAGFWNLLGLNSSLRLQELDAALQRLLTVYTLHLDNRSSPPDARWQALNGTVRDLATDVLNVFAIANEGFRRNKQDPGGKDVERIWKFAQIWAKGDNVMQDKLKITQRLVQEYRKFYQVSLSESSHAILLPLSKALEAILTTPEHLDSEEIILQGAGQLKDAIDRREAYHRPILMNKSIDYSTRQEQELTAIHAFMTTCVKELFEKQYKGDRALLQENRNRIKSGAEFAYRWLSLQEKQHNQSENLQPENS